MKAVGYIRISTEEQAKEGISLGNLITIIGTYSKRKTGTALIMSFTPHLEAMAVMLQMGFEKGELGKSGESDPKNDHIAGKVGAIK